MKKFVCLIPILFVVLTGCATKQEALQLGNRIDTIERRFSREASALREASKDQVSKEELKKENARLIVKYERMEEALRSLEGRLEEFDHSLRQLEKLNEKLATGQERSETRLGELTAQVKQLETYTGYEPGGQPPAPPAPAKEEKSARPTDTALYSKAKHAFDLNSMKEAKSGFLLLLKEYPKSESADNAQFWLGEIYYRDKWYQKAILEYQKVIENYPKGNKVAAAYLKQGLAFLKLGEKENAHLILNELIKKFPDSPEAKIARDRIKRKK